MSTIDHFVQFHSFNGIDKAKIKNSMEYDLLSVLTRKQDDIIGFGGNK